jgi:5-hydroxyisourate hydrolase
MKIITQVLDGTYGKSAAGVQARLAHANENSWSNVADAETDSDGCIHEWHSGQLECGLYRIVFDSDGYFARLGTNSAYPEIVVMFRTEDETQQFQVQVTLSPYSYSTFFGTVETIG